MNNIIRLWNQNRRGIILGIVVIALLIIGIHVLNDIVKKQNEAERENRVVLTEEEKQLPVKSIIGESSTSTQTATENVDILEDFVEKCNNGQITEAYNMLTDDCKEVLFPTEENFRTGYYAMIFSEKRIIDAQSFISRNKRHTYLVKFFNDVMSTGKSQNAQAFQDYITIDENSKNGKLNINSFIYKKEIGKTNQSNGISITILSQEVFKENEKFVIKIENNTDKRIAIDTRQYSKSIYLVGDNNVSYGSNISEIADVLYQIPENMSRTYRLRFDKTYSSYVTSKGIAFTDIVTDYESYLQNTNETKDRVKISVSI